MNFPHALLKTKCTWMLVEWCLKYHTIGLRKQNDHIKTILLDRSIESIF